MIPRETTHKRWTVIVGVLLMIAALGIAGTRDYEDAGREFQHYCAMIDIYEQSDGEYGWPDYKNQQEECDAQDAEPVG